MKELDTGGCLKFISDMLFRALGTDRFDELLTKPYTELFCEEMNNRKVYVTIKKLYERNREIKDRSSPK